MFLQKFIEKQPAFELFRPILPSDHSRQVTAEHYARQVLSAGTGATARNGSTKVLDLGCGAGDSMKFFQEISPAVEWFGVDIQDSQEVRTRTRQDANIATYDGVHLPYEEGLFDLVYSCQVLEHVRHPDVLLPDVFRVLKPGGAFVGSVAYLEPYHSYSIFNFTPYGLMSVCRDAGLDMLELRPSIDGLTVVARQMLNKPGFFRIFFRYSPLNVVIGGLGRVLGLNHRHINFLKLQFTGRICFLARKPGYAGTGRPHAPRI
jgi:SAM-dependent methyltransferase